MPARPSEEIDPPFVRKVASSTFASDNHRHSKIMRHPENGAETVLKIGVFLLKETLRVLILDEVIKREPPLANTRHAIANSVVDHQFSFRGLLCDFVVSPSFDHNLFEVMLPVNTRMW